MKLTRLPVVAAFVVAASAALPGALSTPAGATTRLVPTSIVSAATCTSTQTDVTTALNNWLANTVVNGDVAELGKLVNGSIVPQCYRTDGTVVLGAKTGVTLNGFGSTLHSYGDTSGTPGAVKPHMQVNGNHTTTVKNLNVVGNYDGSGYNSAWAFEPGFYLMGDDQNVTVDTVTVNHVWGDFVQIQRNSSNHAARPVNVTIQNSNFGGNSSGQSGAGRQELSIDDGTNIGVYNNTFTQGSRSAIDIEPTVADSLIDTVTIQGNTFGPNKSFWFSNHGAGATIKHIFLSFNTLNRTMEIDSLDPNAVPASGNGTMWPPTFTRTDYEIVGNTSTVKMDAGACPSLTSVPPTPYGTANVMRIIGVDQLYVEANTQPMNNAARCPYMLEGQQVADVTVAGNSMLNAKTFQVWPNYPSTVSVNSSGVGVYVENSPAPGGIGFLTCEENNYVGPGLTLATFLDPPSIGTC